MHEATYRLTFTSTEPEVPSKTLDLEVALEALIEFQDEDGDGAYDVGERTYQRIRLSDIQDVTQEVAPYYEGGHEVTVRYVLSPPGEPGLPFDDDPDEPPAVLTLRFYMLPEVASIEETVVHPTQSKMSVELRDFRWQANQTHVALHTRATSEGTLEADDDGVATWDGLLAAAYTWDTAAVADDTNISAAVTQLQTHDGAQDVLFAYPHASLILHDPTFGAQRHVQTTIIEGIQSAITEGDPIVYGVGLVATALLIGAVTYTRLRRSA